jgi:uncharacterized iron-regulated membrane protein
MEFTVLAMALALTALSIAAGLGVMWLARRSDPFLGKPPRDSRRLRR